METSSKKPHFYANRVFISSSPYDVILDFQVNIPKMVMSGEKPELEMVDSNTVIMSHAHFKSFVNVLNEQLKIIEESIGEIKILEPPSKDVKTKRN
jgi:hypothetical protein